LRGLRRLEPLPCTKITRPTGAGGRASSPGRRAAPARLVRGLEQGPDLVVGGLAEALVGLADGEEVRGCLELHQLIDDSRDAVAQAGRADGDGEHDALRPPCAQHARARERRAARGHSVVDEHDRASLERDRRAISPIALQPTLQLLLLAHDHRVQLGLRDPQRGYRGRVDQPHAALAERSDAELRRSGGTEFAHDHQVQRRAQPPGDLEGHRDAASRQGHHDRCLQPQSCHTLGEAPPRIPAIVEGGR
jgi:hypothetical protein